MKPNRLPRVTNLSVEKFLSDFVVGNRPTVIADAMKTWPALAGWTPDRLATRFGGERVQVYGDLFRLVDLMTLQEYLDRYFGRATNNDISATSKSIPYVRWYCHLSADERVPWADEVFDRLSDDWGRPEFFPRCGFALPYCGRDEILDPSRDWFPARGLFISGQGARTKLHVDPWCSDALLCQIYGRKDFVMFDPLQAAFLRSGDQVLDIEAPDPVRYPDFSRAAAVVHDTLEPGEIVFVPAGWYHHFNSVTDSISLTWNFVHEARLQRFLDYLRQGPPDTEKRQLRYAYFEAPGRRLVEAETFQATLRQAADWLRHD